MAAKTSFGTVSIYMTELDTTREVKRAEIIPLDATASTFHFFGAGSRHYAVKGLVIGDSDLSQLETWAANNTSQTFTTPWSATANCKLDKTVKSSVLKYQGGVIDGVSYTVDVTPIYNVELEVIPT
jgi:hypothetical protein